MQTVETGFLVSRRSYSGDLRVCSALHVVAAVQSDAEMCYVCSGWPQAPESSWQVEEAEALREITRPCRREQCKIAYQLSGSAVLAGSANLTGSTGTTLHVVST